MRRLGLLFLFVALAALAVGGQVLLRGRRPQAVSVVTEGSLAALGGLRSIAAEIVWFRADRLQEEGRYVELAQLADVLTMLEPQTPEVWCYAAWNLAYNVSVAMPDPEDRWHWVHAGIRLLRDGGLRQNPGSREITRDLAWLFELKLGTNLDSGAEVFRREWRKVVEDVRARGAWHELRMDPAEMSRIERQTGFTDWTDPLLSALYWADCGKHPEIVRQAAILYARNHP